MGHHGVLSVRAITPHRPIRKRKKEKNRNYFVFYFSVSCKYLFSFWYSCKLGFICVLQCKWGIQDGSDLRFVDKISAYFLLISLIIVCSLFDSGRQIKHKYSK